MALPTRVTRLVLTTMQMKFKGVTTKKKGLFGTKVRRTARKSRLYGTQDDGSQLWSNPARKIFESILWDQY